MTGVDTNITIQVPPLYDRQREAVFDDARYSFIEAATKVGKTSSCIIWLLSEAVEKGKNGREFWWVAPVYPQAKIAYERLKRMLRRCDPSGKWWSKHDSDLWVRLATGARIVFKSGEKPDNLYGEDVYGAVLDEATRMREEAWFAVRSTLTATGGRIRIIGNVKGRKNWAYILGQRAKSGADGMAYHKITAWDAVEAGILKREEIESAQRDLPEAVFRELYLAEPSDDAGNPFGIDAIRRNIIDDTADGPVFCWGVDLAKSQDWTVAIGLNEFGEVCAFQRWQSDWMNTVARLKAMLKHAPSLVDETGVGSPVVEALQREVDGVEGFVFTSSNKQELLGGLQIAIHQDRIKYPAGEIVDELESFEYEYTRSGVKYSAPTGLHDDCVMALALAWRRFDTAGLRMDDFRVLNRPMATVTESSDFGWSHF